MKGPKSGRFVCYHSLDSPLSSGNIQTGKQIEEHLLDLEDKGDRPVLI